MEIETFDKRVVDRFIRQGKVTPAQYQEHLDALPDMADHVLLATSDEELLRGMGDMKLRGPSSIDEDNED